MPSTFSVEEHKELGKGYYSRKDYERALSAFTDGINSSHGRDIQLYDYRAAVHDKLGDLTAALADARFMIKAYEADPRGYLRAGQLLVKMDKKQQALQIYARGLRYVSSTHENLNLLRGAHDKLNRELCPPRAIDPFSILPQELVEMILSYLKFYELVSCLRVSKQWKRFLASQPSLWTSMDLFRAGTKRAVRPSFVKTCMRMAQNKITYARIANFKHVGILESLITNCNHLEKLDFVLTPLGSDQILQAVVPARALRALTVHADIEMSGHAVAQILRHRPSLEELRICNVGAVGLNAGGFNTDLPQLRILDLRFTRADFIRSGHLRSVVRHAANLRELIVEDTSKHALFMAHDVLEAATKLEVLRVKFQAATTFPPASITLRELSYECATVFHPASWPVGGYPNLVKLRMQNMLDRMVELLDPCPRNEMMQIPEKPIMLKSVALVNPNDVKDTALDEVLRHERLQELEELSLESLTATSLDDTKVDLIVQLKYLRRLHLESATLTGVGIKKLITELRNTLHHLTLTACVSVGRDVVEWAARQDVVIVVDEGGVKPKPTWRRHG